MENAILTNKHTPCGYSGVLGCGGYQNTDKIICMTASESNNFIADGIVEGSLLFIDPTCKCVAGELNVYKYKAKRTPQYKLSRRKIPHASYIGKVLMSVNQY